jgi:hypothetical protein
MDATASLPTADGASESLSAAGLLLNVFSIVAFTVCLAMFATGCAMLGLILGAFSMATFVASIGCFVIDGRRSRAACEKIPVV